VARKEHEEFASNIDFIDILPPGLYEAVITPRGGGEPGADLIVGNYLIRFVARDVEDVRAIVGTDPEDERRFAAAARISEINLGLYRSFLQPLVRNSVSEPLAEWMRRMHPLRLPYELLSDQNPMMRPLAGLAERVRKERKPAAANNSLTKLEAEVAHQIDAALDGYRDLRDRWCEQLFLAIYGSPLLQALVGLRARDESPRHRPGDDPDHLDFVARRKAELLDQIGAGGLREAALRALLYVLMPQRATDERSFNLLRRMRDERGGGITLAEFKAALRDQGFMLLLDRERAVATLPLLLAEGSAEQIRSAPRGGRLRAARGGIRGPARRDHQGFRGGSQGLAGGTGRDSGRGDADSPREGAGAGSRGPAGELGGLIGVRRGLEVGTAAGRSMVNVNRARRGRICRPARTAVSRSSSAGVPCRASGDHHPPPSQAWPERPASGLRWSTVHEIQALDQALSPSCILARAPPRGWRGSPSDAGRP
jgi:hypothetical protein